MDWAQIIGGAAVILAAVASALQSRSATSHAKQARAEARAASGWAMATHAAVTGRGPGPVMAPQIPDPAPATAAPPAWPPAAAGPTGSTAPGGSL